MARNLRAKIGSSDTLTIHDVNPDVTKKFAEEVGNVTVAKNVREVAEHSVRIPLGKWSFDLHILPNPLMMIVQISIVLSMI